MYFSDIMLKEGDKAPNFRLLNDEGKIMSLEDFKGKKVVLYFYCKDMTPGCTLESIDFAKNYKKFKEKNAEVVGICTGSVKSHRKFKEKYNLPFYLLVDDKKTAKAFGVWKRKSLYGKKFMGIERTTFIIDENGRIEKIFPKVKVESHVEEVLKYL